MFKLPISLIEAQAIASQMFGLDLPLNLEQLKKALRAKQFEYHPDRNIGKEEWAAEVFKSVMGGYERLITCAAAFSETEYVRHSTKTEDGRPLTELGLGLGHLVNARDCELCDHKGYTITFEKTWIVCDDCDAEGNPLITKTCRDCKGSGKFTLRSKRIVDCRTCGGKGTVKFKQKPNDRQKSNACFGRSIFGMYGFNFGPRCQSCYGTKKKDVDDKMKPVYHTCTKCAGTGEIRIFNPVIRKGALQQKKKN